ncbi:MAG TPA: cyclodeaminase/cyclohydrolase family protein, partial [Chthoniobacterales bacterium]|nr:cyclodeaminase/cyclohydrolase family protein [Chthoniobacterales bacterium]
ASISDVGVGLLATRACIDGAGFNVLINLAGLKDVAVKTELEKRVREIATRSEVEVKKISHLVESKLS